MTKKSEDPASNANPSHPDSSMKAVKSAMPDSKAERLQSDKFRDLARELECDEDEALFEEAVKKVAKPEPRGEPKK